MEKSEIFFEVIIAIAMLTAMSRLIFHDSLLVSFIFAVGLTAFFWIGRLSVRFYKRKKRIQDVLDE